MVQWKSSCSREKPAGSNTNHLSLSRQFPGPSPDFPYNPFEKRTTTTFTWCSSYNPQPARVNYEKWPRWSKWWLTEFQLKKKWWCPQTVSHYQTVIPENSSNRAFSTGLSLPLFSVGEGAPLDLATSVARTWTSSVICLVFGACDITYIYIYIVTLAQTCIYMYTHVYVCSSKEV